MLFQICKLIMCYLPLPIWYRLPRSLQNAISEKYISTIEERIRG